MLSNLKIKMNYTNYNPNRRPYNPKAAVKNFTDLEVYQKALEGSVFVANEVMNFLKASKAQATQKYKNTRTREHKNIKTQIMDNQEFSSQEIESMIIKSMSITALSIPHLIAESHS